MTRLPSPQASDERLSIPQTPEDISAQWLGEALAETCNFAADAVTSVAVEQIGEGRGSVGLILRLTPAYDGEPTDAPASLVAKLPRFVEHARGGDRMLVNTLYANEIRWYGELAEHCPVRVPRSYWSGMDRSGGRFCLLLEDLGDLGTRSQIESCDAADARLVVSKLAQIHATWWGDPTLERRAWMLGPDQLGASAMHLWSLGWERFKEFIRAELPPEFVEIGERLGPQMLALSQRGAASASTLVHGDYRLENFLFGDPAGDAALCVLDWQGVSRGSGLRDLGYFIGQNLTVDLRRGIEDDLLHLYHDTLRENGVSDYSFQQCYDDYRMGLLAALWIPVNGLRMFPAVDEGLRTITGRNITAVLDNDAQAMLEG